MISLIPWFLIVKYVKERCELIPIESESFWSNIKYVFKNPACRVYMVYDGITVGIFNTFFMAITFVMTWTFGVENPFMAHPLTFLDIIPYLIFPIFCAILGIIMQFWIPKKWDLKTLLLIDYLFMLVGFLIAYFGALPSLSQSDVVFESPPNLWLVSIGLGVLILGFFGNLIYLDPLNADVVDYDEILTGNRRESVYSGTNCILSKTMQSVVLVVFPAILSLYGLVPASPDDPTSSALVVHTGFHNAIRGVAVASFLFLAILALVGFISFLCYPLNGKKLQEIRRVLDEKHVRQKEVFEVNHKKN